VTFIGMLRAAGRRLEDRAAAKRTVVAGTAVALVAALAPCAAADPVGDTQNQIAALEQQINAGAAQIHQLTAAFQEANLQAATLAQQVSTDTATLASMQQQLASREKAVTSAALGQYTGQQPPPGSIAALGEADPAVKAVYLEVATGSVSDSVDQLRVSQLQVQQQRQVLATEQQQAQAAVQAADAARTQALSLATTEQNRLGGLQQQLAQEVAAKQAADAAAAQAAQAAAAQAAEAAAAHASSGRPAPAATQGGPVNNGLVDTVQAVVGTPAPAASAPATTPAPPPAATPAVTPSGGASGVWAQLRQCEAGGNYAENTGNGFYGAYQFTQSTWTGLGYPGRPDQEPPAMQDAAAQQLQARSGWGQWPACSAALGLS
jgi:peptidoglycan hydrolase CwlO-like protein